MQEKVRHETFALKALIQKRVGSTLDRVGATLEEIDREVEAFDAEQGRSRIAKYIEEAVIEPPKTAAGRRRVRRGRGARGHGLGVPSCGGAFTFNTTRLQE